MTQRKRNLTLVSLLTVAGCGQLIGLGDYDIDPSLDPGNQGGSSILPQGGEAGEGGSPSGGKSGSGGTGAAPQGGQGGEGVTPGTGGDGGERPTVVGGAGGGGPDSKFEGCDGTPFQGNDAIVRSCILRVGCQVWNYPTDSISRCISQNTQNTYEGTKCTLDARTCADIAECEGTYGGVEAFCKDKADGQYCNDGDIVECGDYPYATNCAKYGGVCQDFGTEINAYGDTAACALPNVTSCTDTDEEAACGGPANAYKYQCFGTTAYGTKCSNFAASCQDVGSGVGCYYPLNTCSAEGVTCANDRATWCDGSSRATFDCGSVGLGCSTTGDYYDDNGRQCGAPGCTPDDIANCEESCDDDHLTFCYGGAKVTVDCKDYGFTSCVEYDYDCSGGAAMNDCLYTSDVVHFAECE